MNNEHEQAYALAGLDRDNDTIRALQLDPKGHVILSDHDVQRIAQAVIETLTENSP